MPAIRSNKFLVILGVTALVGCHRAQQQAKVAQPEAEVAQPDIAVIRRTFGAPNPEYVRLGWGRVDIVLRLAEQPTLNIRGIYLIVKRDSAETSIRRVADSLGVVRFDSLPVGRYTVQGMLAPIHFKLNVEAGCRTDVELYQGTAFIGIAPPPNMPPRAIITTCPTSASNR